MSIYPLHGDFREELKTSGARCGRNGRNQSRRRGHYSSACTRSAVGGCVRSDAPQLPKEPDTAARATHLRRRRN
jgi:hypothetical protein